MVRSFESTVSLGDPVTASGDSWVRRRRCPWVPVLAVAEKNFTPLLNCIKLPLPESLLVPMNPPAEPVVLDPDRVQVVFPEPRTPSTLMINAALAVAQASARPISVTRRLAWRSGEVAKWRSGEVAK